MKKVIWLCVFIISIILPSILSYGEDTPVYFTNPTYDYTLTLPDNATVEYGDSEENKDRVITIRNKDELFSAVIACDRLDEEILRVMRDYFNEPSSTDEEVFRRYVQYKKSYFSALQDYYKRSFLYGENDEKSTEYNMKIFGEYSADIAGQKSEITLYNTIKSDNTGSSEQTHIDVLVPFLPSMTVYSINFTLDKGTLDARILGRISGLINSIRLSGIEVKTDFFQTLVQEDAVSAANLGIYPFPGGDSKTYNILINTDSGYVLTYPSTFVPYMQNSIIDAFDYKSFKTNAYSHFSVCVEPAAGSGDAIESKISAIKAVNGTDMKVIEKGTTKGFKNEYTFFKYKVETADGPLYMQHYLITGNSRLYDVQLCSRFTRPTAAIENEFLKTVDSLVVFPPSPSIPQPVEPAEFINREEGYTFLYPAEWQLSQNQSADVNYDSFTVKNPDLSGALDVSVAEGEFHSGLPTDEVLKYLLVNDSMILKKYFKKYAPPYEGRPARLLNTSYSMKDGIVYLYRLVNYLDSNNRSRLCSIVDIIRGKKIYSLFVSVSEYLTEDGKISDNRLQASLNTIMSSFGLKDTQEFLARQAAGEIRNRKVVFIEEYFKKLYGESARVLSAVSTEISGEVLINLNGASNAGFYTVKLDYNKKEIEQRNTVLKSKIKSDCKRLLEEMIKTDLSVSFQPDAEFLSEKDVSPDGSRYLTAVHAEFAGISGYFVFEIDPVQGNMKTVSFTPADSIFESIKKNYSGTDKEIEPVNYIVDGNDKFKFIVFFHSKQDNTIKSEQVTIKRSGTIVIAE